MCPTCLQSFRLKPRVTEHRFKRRSHCSPRWTSDTGSGACNANAAADGSRAHGGWPPSALSSRGFGGSILIKRPGCGNCRVRKPAFDRATQGHGVAKGWGWTSHSKNPKPPAASLLLQQQGERAFSWHACWEERQTVRQGRDSLTDLSQAPADIAGERRPVPGNAAGEWPAPFRAEQPQLCVLL